MAVKNRRAAQGRWASFLVSLRGGESSTGRGGNLDRFRRWKACALPLATLYFVLSTEYQVRSTKDDVHGLHYASRNSQAPLQRGRLRRARQAGAAKSVAARADQAADRVGRSGGPLQNDAVDRNGA